ncbi:MAG: ExbD/TolR family protein [Bdellovibrionia bacterium]
MAIFKPGQRHRYHNILSKRKGKRDPTVVLSLTAMVDMFTVLVIFLLQNYNATGEILYIPKEVTLPKASSVKELKPAVVVTISSSEVLVDRTPVATIDQVKTQEDWLIPGLQEEVKKAIGVAKAEYQNKLQTKIKNVIEKDAKTDDQTWNKVTIQADKGVDFLTVKKIMYTVTESGAGEINFAVTKIESESTTN